MNEMELKEYEKKWKAMSLYFQRTTAFGNETGSLANGEFEGIDSWNALKGIHSFLISFSFFFFPLKEII